jgi:hypothetical protein
MQRVFAYGARARREIEAFACATVNDSGVVPLKLRASGGTLCEIVAKGHCRKPGK